ncbi:hypothetical protein GDO81_001553 [Engystomops pustulosus]|uniref:Uncharacterized protein n=1 Tax=Engystomops pustulosus TaxID=76066 RepID=A0AAV7DH92_ENGPU|nr:hypothetical protein GDO81_001553 [Engystomops pustulosus]
MQLNGIFQSLPVPVTAETWLRKSQRKFYFTGINLTPEFASFHSTACYIIILLSLFDDCVANNYYREYSVDVLQRSPSLTRVWREVDT